MINLNYYVESEDYSQYAFPALRALEGHIKYLIILSGGTVERNFTCFGYDKTVIPNKYIVTTLFPDNSKKQYILKIMCEGNTLKKSQLKIIKSIAIMFVH